MTIRIDWGDVVIGVVLLLFVALLVFCVAQLVVSARTDAICAQYGWRDSKITWNFKSYCVREENEYEIIRPLDEIRKQE